MTLIISMNTEIEESTNNVQSKVPRVKKERHPEPREPIKPGRKVGQISNPERHPDDGKYKKGPLDPEYFKKYYREVIAHSGPCVCDVCGSTLATSQGLNKHYKTQYCRRALAFKSIPDISTLISIVDGSEDVMN